jgi:4-hydroxybenzoate polyprenyltransferase
VALLVAFLPAVVLAAFADYGQTWDAAVAVLSAGAAVWAGTTAVSLLARYADRRTREESS